jgi:hypothetical protein
VWRIYLDKALQQGDDKLFDVAFEYSKNKASDRSADDVNFNQWNVFSQDQKNRIMRAQAEFCMSSGKPEKAAACFAKSDLSFDEVVLKLIRCALSDAGTAPGVDSSSVCSSLEDLRGLILTGGAELTPLRVYLSEVLKTLPLGAKSQRTMLCTWLCELFLHQISVAAISATAATTTSVVVPVLAKEARNSKSGASQQTAAASAGQSEAELTVQFKDFLRANK